MSVRKINLRKLLQITFSDARQQRSLLLKDIREDKARASSDNAGGDFYGPFWSDAKKYVAGGCDLIAQTEIRIKSNKRRERLYPVLCNGFLDLWKEKMRWRNEPFEFFPQNIKAMKDIPELGAAVKIENTASVKLWDGSNRIIYPYFSEEPALPKDGARLGFWALWEALPGYAPSDFRIIDIQRRSYFRPSEIKFTGHEKDEFLGMYKAIIDLWIRLRDG